MKKTDFLLRLKKGGKIKIVEPNEELKESYINKSNHSLNSSTILLQNNEIENAIPLAYYSMYNMLTALLYKTGIKCENHTASIIILKDLFNIDNSQIKFAKRERVEKQYYTDFKLAKKDVEDLIDKAKNFNAVVYDFVEKLTKKQIEDYRKEIKECLDEEER